MICPIQSFTSPYKANGSLGAQPALRLLGAGGLDPVLGQEWPLLVFPHPPLCRLPHVELSVVAHLGPAVGQDPLLPPWLVKLTARLVFCGDLLASNWIYHLYKTPPQPQFPQVHHLIFLAPRRILYRHPLLPTLVQIQTSGHNLG